MNDILTAFSALNRPTEPQGMSKYMPPVILALVIGLLGWVGTTLMSVNTSVGIMATSLASVQKSVDDLNVTAKAQNDKIADLQTRIGQHDLRLNAIDQLDTRMGERIRLVEGQKPLSQGNLQ